QSPARPRLAGFDAVAVAEGVELLDIAQSLAGLSFDPGAQSDLERTVLDLERAGGQRLDRLTTDANAEDARLFDRRGHDCPVEPDRQRRPTAALGRDLVGAQRGCAADPSFHAPGSPLGCFRRILPHPLCHQLAAMTLS